MTHVQVPVRAVWYEHVPVLFSAASKRVQVLDVRSTFMVALSKDRGCILQRSSLASAPALATALVDLPFISALLARQSSVDVVLPIRRRTEI